MTEEEDYVYLIIRKDNVILPRVSQQQNSDTDYTDKTVEHLEDFAKEGLRTLVIASREISEEEYSVCVTLLKRAISLNQFLTLNT